MKLSVSSLAALLLLPAATLSAQAAPATADASPAASPEPAPVLRTADEGSASIRASLFCANGAGQAGQLLHREEAQVDDWIGSMSQIITMMSSKSNVEHPGRTKPQGTLYGVEAGYDFSTRALGSCTVEFGYRGGTVDYDSGRRAFSGTVETPDRELVTNGYTRRTYSADTERFSILALWRPKAALGEYVAMGFGYAREKWNLQYSTLLALDPDGVGFFGNMKQIDESFAAKFVSDNVLFHVRAGGKPLPWISARDGSWGIVPTADLATGYSFRALDHFTATETVNDFPPDTYVVDGRNVERGTWIFEGSARLRFFHTLGKGTVLLDAGYACEAEFGGSASGDQQGFVGSVGYTYTW